MDAPSSVVRSIVNNLLFPWLLLSYRFAGMTDDLPFPCCPVRLLTRSQSNAFQIVLARIFPSCFLSSLFLFPGISILNTSLSMCSSSLDITCPYQFNHLSVIFQDTCSTLIVPLMCSFLILSLRVTPHIHRCILISVTSIRFSCRFIVAHISAPYRQFQTHLLLSYKDGRTVFSGTQYVTRILMSRITDTHHSVPDGRRRYLLFGKFVGSYIHFFYIYRSGIHCLLCAQLVVLVQPFFTSSDRGVCLCFQVGTTATSERSRRRRAHRCTWCRTRTAVAA